MMRTGREGKLCADAGIAVHAAMSAAAISSQSVRVEERKRLEA